MRLEHSRPNLSCRLSPKMDILYSDISYINQHINLAGQATPVGKLCSYLWLPFPLGSILKPLWIQLHRHSCQQAAGQGCSCLQCAPWSGFLLVELLMAAAVFTNPAKNLHPLNGGSLSPCLGWNRQASGGGWDKEAKGLKVGSECLERSLGKPFISHPIREQWVGNKAQILTENLKGTFQHE